MAGTGRFGRKRTTSVYAGQSVEMDQAVMTLDLLRALGWLVRHGVDWPGRPGDELAHLLVGPPGVFVLDIDDHETEVDVASPEAWQERADAALAAATDVAAALPGVPVTPVLCFVRAEAFTGVAGSVFLCSLRTIVEVLSHAPVRLDDATLAAVRQEVADGLAAPADAVTTVEPPAAAPAVTSAATPVMTPVMTPAGSLEDGEPELLPSPNYDLYAELGRLDVAEDVTGDVDAVAAGERIAEEAAREQQRLEAEQLLESERIAAAEAERAEQERLAREREEQERLAAAEAARAEDARREAERLDAERREAEWAELARQEEQRQVAERAAAVRAEVARREEERLASERAAEPVDSAVAVEPAHRAGTTGPAPAGPAGKPDRFALPKGKAVKAAGVVAALVLGGLLLQEPIGTAAGSVKALFTERAPARFGEQVNVGKTLYHPRLRLHAGQPVAVPARAEVAVPFTVRNGSDEAWVLEGADLVMLDRVGISHPAKAGPMIPQGPLLGASTPVPAGETVTGFLLFDLPQGQTVKEVRLALGPDEPAEGAEDPVVWFARAR